CLTTGPMPSATRRITLCWSSPCWRSSRQLRSRSAGPGLPRTPAGSSVAERLLSEGSLRPYSFRAAVGAVQADPTAAYRRLPICPIEKGFRPYLLTDHHNGSVSPPHGIEGHEAA